LLHASQKKAAREVQLQIELDKINHDVQVDDQKSKWDTISAYRTYCQQCNATQQQLLLQLADVNDPLSILPETLAEQKKLLLDALTRPYDSEPGNEQVTEERRNETIVLRQTATQLEEKLVSLQQRTMTKDFSWVDSFLTHLDSQQFSLVQKQYEEQMLNEAKF
jgi:hypothetical protein